MQIFFFATLSSDKFNCATKNRTQEEGKEKVSHMQSNLIEIFDKAENESG